MTPARSIPALLAAAAACLGLSACGGADEGDPIPGGKAAALRQQLDRVAQAVRDGTCEDVGPAVSRLQTQIANLEADGVGDDVQDALGDGADNLRSLATSECEPEQEKKDPVDTTPVEPPPTETVEPPPTETTPPPTETTPAPVPEPEPEPLPPEEEPDDGGAGVPPGQQKKIEGDG